MKTGIYCLYYETDDNNFYIGKSINIDTRYKDHCKKLKYGNHHNKLLSKLYQGVPPTLAILEENIANDNILNEREIYWIREFDSLNNGMNETMGGEGMGFGNEHPNALYTNEIYYNILVELSKDYNSILNISKTLKVSQSVVHAISTGGTHGWLADKYPELYLKMKNRKKLKSGCNDLAARGINYPPIVSPEGIEYTVTNIREFARIHNLANQELGRVLRGQRKTTKGWYLKTC